MDYQYDKISKLQMERDYYKVTAESPNFIEKVVRDTVVITQQKIVEVAKSDYKKLTAIPDIVQSVGGTSSVLIESNFVKEVTDTVKPILVDTVFRYSDTWANIVFHPADTSFTYNVRDSIDVLVTKRYRHKFWFLRWGKKSYYINVVNHNPHSRISYLSTVAVE